MHPNAMTPATERKVIREEAKLEAKAKALKTKGVYRRLLNNEDFQQFYDYLEMCYNSYIDTAGEPQLERHHREFLNIQASAYKKTLDYIKRQAS